MSIDPIADKKDALRGALDLAKHQITLATGVVVFGGTLLKVLLEPQQLSELPSCWLFASWGVSILSIMLGLFASGRYITQLSQSNYDIEDKWLSGFSRAQQISFFLGIVLFGIFATLAWS